MASRNKRNNLQNLNDQFFLKFIVSTVNEHENICRAELNRRRAGSATAYTVTLVITYMEMSLNVIRYYVLS